MGLPPKTGPVSRPDRLPSAAFGPPSAAIAGLWVVVKRGYGSPPSNSPRLSICNIHVIYKVEVVGVVYRSHTPEESADETIFYNIIAQ